MRRVRTLMVALTMLSVIGCNSAADPLTAVVEASPSPSASPEVVEDEPSPFEPHAILLEPTREPLSIRLTHPDTIAYALDAAAQRLMGRNPPQEHRVAFVGEIHADERTQQTAAYEGRTSYTIDLPARAETYIREHFGTEVDTYRMAQYAQVIDDMSQGDDACEYRGIRLYGQVEVVDYGGDIQIQEVSYGADLRVQSVEYGANSCGEWEFVDYGADFTVEFVNYSADLEIEFVSYNPGR